MKDDKSISNWLDSLGDAEKFEILNCLDVIQKDRTENKIKQYKPYPKQKEFHAASADFAEVLFMGANQSGKTVCGAYEMAIHLTGEYPEWWTGRRFDKGIRAVASSKTFSVAVNGAQRYLLGDPALFPDSFGTGAIPKSRIVRFKRKTGSVANSIEIVVVKHKSGTESSLRFMAYEQGRETWQADTLSLIWFDEEPPSDVYFEGITRVLSTKGQIYITFTPLKGRSEVVNRFYPIPFSKSCSYIQFGMKDALHYTEEDLAAALEKYPPHEQQARLYGIPQFGSGMVFAMPEESYTCNPFQIPKTFRKGIGLDFGWDHLTGATLVCHDPDTDTYYVVAEYGERQATPLITASALKGWGDIPVFWPHDGLQHDKGSGLQLAQQYREQGLDMWKEQVSHPEGGNGVEAGVMMMVQMLQSGKLKIFKNCEKLLSEMRNYHRDEGIIVKKNDDIVSSLRYALMMKRFFHQEKVEKPLWQRKTYNNSRASRAGF